MRLKTFTIQIDEKIDNTINWIQGELGGKTSKAEVFRLAIALLRIALEGRRDRLKVALVGDDDKVHKELVLPIH